MVYAGGVVLAGGRSTRMGTAKADLEWHGSTLLRRITGLVERATGGPVLVVRAPGQTLPRLARTVDVVDDPEEGLGPLQGIAAGLTAMAARAEAAFVCSTDVPFLHPAFVRRVLRALDDGAEVALPHTQGYPQPLAAAYRTSLGPTVEKLVAARRLRPAFLWESCTVARLGEDLLLADAALSAYDPGLDSVVNVNTPEEYAAARSRPAPEVTVERHGAPGTAAGARRVRAATLGSAAEAAGVVLDGNVVAVLNGDPVEGETDTPLAAGDTVAFRAAPGDRPVR